MQKLIQPQPPNAVPYLGRHILRSGRVKWVKGKKQTGIEPSFFSKLYTLESARDLNALNAVDKNKNKERRENVNRKKRKRRVSSSSSSVVLLVLIAG